MYADNCSVFKVSGVLPIAIVALVATIVASIATATCYTSRCISVCTPCTYRRCTTPWYEIGDYDGVVHAIGMLFAGSLNRFASGSGSVPDPGTTYDMITKQTAFAATAALSDLARGGPQVQSWPAESYAARCSDSCHVTYSDIARTTIFLSA